MRFFDVAAAALRGLPAETAHRAALRALKAGLAPARPAVADPMLSQTLWGLSFGHPVGVAAGFDKNAEAPDALLDLGAAFVEIGGVTPRPQRGNPRPRLFRLVEDQAIINRMGFNNDGLEVVSARLRARRPRRAATRAAGAANGTAPPAKSGVVIANLGANKDSTDRMADYETGLRGLWGLVDAHCVNVSSPNTERLRDLQGSAALTALLARVLAARDEVAAERGGWAPVLVKIAPDLDAGGLADVASIALEIGVDGIVATNTTTARAAGLKSARRTETGGLSGAPLFERSTEALRALRRHVGDRIPLIGVGGVSSPEQAYAKIRAGAALTQLYTGLVYEGPGLLARIAEALPELLRRDGFSHVSEAVGVDA